MKIRLLNEIWGEFEPFLIKISVDALIAYTLWISLYIFKKLTWFLDIDTPVGKFIETIHSVGTMTAFCVFGILFFLDVRDLRKEEKSRKEAEVRENEGNIENKSCGCD